jgi:hypothetical protein
MSKEIDPTEPYIKSTIVLNNGKEIEFPHIDAMTYPHMPDDVGWRYLRRYFKVINRPIIMALDTGLSGGSKKRPSLLYLVYRCDDDAENGIRYRIASKKHVGYGNEAGADDEPLCVDDDIEWFRKYAVTEEVWALACELVDEQDAHKETKRKIQEYFEKEDACFVASQNLRSLSES